MLKFNKLVFDEVIQVEERSVDYHTKQDFDEPLGHYDKLAIQVVADDTTTTGEAPALVLDVETSCDGRHWVTKGDRQYLFLKMDALVTACFFDDGSAPNYGLVRLRMSLTEGARAAAHVRVYVTARDIGRVPHKAANPNKYKPVWDPAMHSERPKTCDWTDSQALCEKYGGKEP